MSKKLKWFTYNKNSEVLLEEFAPSATSPVEEIAGNVHRLYIEDEYQAYTRFGEGVFQTEEEAKAFVEDSVERGTYG